MIFAAFALVAFGLSECVTSTETQSYYGFNDTFYSYYTSNNGYYSTDIFDSSQCTIETDRIWRDSNFNDKVKDIYDYDLYYSDPDACIIDVATGLDHCTYDLSVLPEEVINQFETLCHSYDGVFYLENHTNPYIVTDANESVNGTSVFIESPQCYGLCTEDEVRDYFGATNLTLSAPSYGSERVNCTLETERTLVDYAERIPSAVTEIFDDESLCSDSTGALICHRDFSVLPIELIKVAEDECHDVGGVFYSIDGRTLIVGDEVVETITALPYCFGTCSEDQLIYLLEREAGIMNVKLTKEPNFTKEPNEEPPKEDTSSTSYMAWKVLASVLPIALLVFHL